MELYPLIITLRDGMPRTEQVNLVRRVRTWSEVASVGELQSDPALPEVPPYFLIYVRPKEDRNLLIGRLCREFQEIAAAEIPPVRFAASVRSANQLDSDSTD